MWFNKGKYIHTIVIFMAYWYCIIHLVISNSDLDECDSEGLNDCHPEADCTNTEGSYNCDCRQGYNGTGIMCTGKLPPP